jgi:ParB-like chromosome segregation protein Spo0J
MKTAAALAVRYMPIARLSPFKGNAKLHPPEHVAELAAIIKANGWTQPILADEKGVILAGHGRIKAAKKLKMTKVPVIVLRGLTEAQKIQINIADNKTTADSDNDPLKLAEQLMQLKELGGDIKLAAFSVQEFESLTLTPAEKPGENGGGQFIPEAWDVLVSCAGEGSQRELLDQLTEKGYKCRALVR